MGSRTRKARTKGLAGQARDVRDEVDRVIGPDRREDFELLSGLGRARLSRPRARGALASIRSKLDIYHQIGYHAARFAL